MVNEIQKERVYQFKPNRDVHQSSVRSGTIVHVPSPPRCETRHALTPTSQVKGKRVREQFPEGYFERTPSASRNMASKGLRFPFLETPAKAFSAIARGYPRFISAESTSSSTALMAGTAATS